MRKARQENDTSGRTALGIADWPALDRVYAILAFDWDGTAVKSRQHPTDALRERTALLDEMGVWLVIITGTKYENLEAQYFSKLPAEARLHHIACVNRGSEVFGFDDRGQRQILQRRIATARENEKMDAIATRVCDELARCYGLKTSIIFNRFNRRKLDLIPASEWSDPPKERIGDLLEAVKARLAKAGVEGGIEEIMDRVGEAGRELGIELQLTSDVKHVEFGLTDKSDSVKYIADRLAPAHGIRVDDILVLGDEFGPIDAVEGSDARTYILDGAAYASVGVEPSGVPEGVVHVGGGTGAFLAILDHQIWLRRNRMSP